MPIKIPAHTSHDLIAFCHTICITAILYVATIFLSKERKMSSHSRAHPAAISFRPDAETIAAIARIQVMSGLQDRSAVLRESVRVMEAQLLLETVARACALHAAESERIVEEFEMAGDDI
jgi:hypothetical protein